jgi:ubiquitin-conjugating enzyme E2 variant
VLPSAATGRSAGRSCRRARDETGVASSGGQRLAASWIVVAGLLAAGHALRLLVGVGADPQAALAIFAGLLCGALAADAVTGLVHWACDTWGSDRTRWLGAALIRDFRIHHRDPDAMLAHDWVSVNAAPGAAACVGLGLLALPAWHPELAARPFAYSAMLALLVFGGAANQLHQWAHAPRVPRWVRGLQQGGVLLSPRRHARHHAAEHTAAYCISTGWLNPLLDGVGAWRTLERVIETLTGVAPRSESARTEPL